MPRQLEAFQTEKKELEIERIPKSELKGKEDQPVFKEKMKFTEEQITRLRNEIFKGFENLEAERVKNKFYQTIDNLQAQYDGEMDDDTGLEFVLNVPITQVKVDSITRLTIKAFLETDPKFTITARPSLAKKDKWDVVIHRQSDYLDYKFDEEIDIESPLRKV